MNISGTGMFIGTSSPMARGTRVRVEVQDPQHGFVIEGVVARALRMPASFQQMGLSGMGVRFLPIEELVGPLFAGASAGAAPSAERRRPTVGDARGSPAPATGEAAPTSPPPPAAPPPPVAPAERSPGGAFPVTFRDLDHFAEVMRRDMMTGGVFVPSPEPPPLHARIIVEIVPPLPGEKPIRALATVVRRVTDGTTPGVGVAFLDPKAVAKELTPLAQKLGG